jgi:hypothetical protein
VTKIAPAHSGCFDREDDLAFIGRRIRKILEREFSVTEKHHAAHVGSISRSS